MSFSTLKFPPSLFASAIECEGVARLTGRTLKLEESSDVGNLSLGRSLRLILFSWTPLILQFLVHWCTKWAVQTAWAKTSHFCLCSLTGLAATTTFLAGPLNPLQEARLLQARGFVDSELRWAIMWNLFKSDVNVQYRILCNSPVIMSVGRVLN